MKKNVFLLLVLGIGLSLTSCSADEMYGEPEMSVNLSGGDKDRDWDKMGVAGSENEGSENP